MFDPHDIRITSHQPTGYAAGGMMVGTNPSGVTAYHIPSGIGVSCDSERSQYANKAEALRLLEILIDGINSSKLCAEIQPAYDLPITQYTPTPVVASKVLMIKRVREVLGCGLKEAKDLVYANWQTQDCFSACIAQHRTDNGSCKLGEGCVCGGDLPAIREGCYNWVQR